MHFGRMKNELESEKLQKYLLDHPSLFATCHNGKIKLQTPRQVVMLGFRWLLHPSGAAPPSHQSCFTSHAPELLLLSLLPFLLQCSILNWQHLHTPPPDPIGRGRLATTMPIKIQNWFQLGRGTSILIYPLESSRHHQSRYLALLIFCLTVHQVSRCRG